METYSRIKEKIMLAALVVVAICYFVFTNIDYDLLTPIFIKSAVLSIPAGIAVVAISFIRPEKIKLIIGRSLLFLGITILPIFVRKATPASQAILALVGLVVTLIAVAMEIINKKKQG